MAGTDIVITSVKLDAVPLALSIANPVANPIVAGQEIATGETDTYVVEIVFTVDPATPAADDGSACGQILNPGIGVVKTATADPVQVGSTNQYTVDYTSTVSNTGPAAGRMVSSISPASVQA